MFKVWLCLVVKTSWLGFRVCQNKYSDKVRGRICCHGYNSEHVVKVGEHFSND